MRISGICFGVMLFYVATAAQASCWGSDSLACKESYFKEFVPNTIFIRERGGYRVVGDAEFPENFIRDTKANCAEQMSRTEVNGGMRGYITCVNYWLWKYTVTQLTEAEAKEAIRKNLPTPARWEAIDTGIPEYLSAPSTATANK